MRGGGGGGGSDKTKTRLKISVANLFVKSHLRTSRCNNRKLAKGEDVRQTEVCLAIPALETRRCAVTRKLYKVDCAYANGCPFLAEGLVVINMDVCYKWQYVPRLTRG
jgi:hypothetical protein